MDPTSGLGDADRAGEDGIGSEGDKDCRSSDDTEYNANEEEGEDETTIAEQEIHEGDVDHAEELEALQKEGRRLSNLSSSLGFP